MARKDSRVRSNLVYVACGTSCRHQIAEGASREARHIVRILDEASAARFAATAANY
jgi:hypothetical protein